MGNINEFQNPLPLELEVSKLFSERKEYIERLKSIEGTINELKERRANIFKNFITEIDSTEMKKYVSSTFYEEIESRDIKIMEEKEKLFHSSFEVKSLRDLTERNVEEICKAEQEMEEKIERLFNDWKTIEKKMKSLIAERNSVYNNYESIDRQLFNYSSDSGIKW